MAITKSLWNYATHPYIGCVERCLIAPLSRATYTVSFPVDLPSCAGTSCTTIIVGCLVDCWDPSFVCRKIFFRRVECKTDAFNLTRLAWCRLSYYLWKRKKKSPLPQTFVHNRLGHFYKQHTKREL